MQKYFSRSLFVTATKIMAIKTLQLPTKYDAQWEIKGRHLLIQIGRNGAVLKEYRGK
jgi:hypothetical protein